VCVVRLLMTEVGLQLREWSVVLEQACQVSAKEGKCTAAPHACHLGPIRALSHS
jgi:hypothetical protein